MSDRVAGAMIEWSVFVKICQVLSDIVLLGRDFRYANDHS